PISSEGAGGPAAEAGSLERCFVDDVAPTRLRFGELSTVLPRGWRRRAMRFHPFGTLAIPVSGHEFLPELIQVRPPAQEDDAVSSREAMVAAGGELDAAVGVLDRDDDHSGKAADVGVAEGQPGQRARLADRYVVHLDGQAGAPRNQLGELDGRRVG